MLLNALYILMDELNAHFNQIAPNNAEDTVVLGNIAQYENNAGTVNNNLKNKIVISLVNFREDKTLRNGPYSRVNHSTLKTEYFNPSIYANLFILFSATTANYAHGINYLSRLIRFFQGKKIFTQDNIIPVNTPPLKDRLEKFKFIIELYSPTFEELNHLWGTLGGRQFPSVLYVMRLLELEREEYQEGGKVILEIDNHYKHKKN